MSQGLIATGRSHSERFRAREQTAVHGVNDWLSADLPTAKVPPIETLDGIFASADTFEFEVNVAGSIWIEGDVDDMAVLLLAFGADIVFELFDPSVTFFSIQNISRA